jgi:hypothetical protein
MPKLLMRLLRFLLLGLVFLVGGLAVVWTAGALYFDLPAPAPLRTVGLPGLYALLGRIAISGTRFVCCVKKLEATPDPIDGMGLRCNTDARGKLILFVYEIF